jgi:hypothetical protein
MIKLKNILNEAKVIKVKFSDNDQTLYFSDGEKSKVDYDGEFKYKGKWFDTSDMNSSKDLEKMLSKAFPGTKFIQTESVNESSDINSLKKIHDAIFKFLRTKKGVGEVKEFSEFPNRYGDDVSTFSVKYNIEDKYNYDLQEIKIEYSTSRVFIPNKGYFPFRTFNDIKNIINTKSSLKESVNESDLKGYLVADVVDDIIKSIGTRFVSGEIKQSNKNKIYLKLKDVKFGSGVVKILKSRFGIDAKEEMFGGKDKFGSIPSVSFFANKVVSESVNEVKTYKRGDKLKIKLPNGKQFDVVFVDYSNTKGIAFGKFKIDGEVVTKPFSLSSVKESVNEEKVYIDYLNKAKGFKQDRIKFNSYEDAVKWAKKNFEKFNPDMIKYESVNESAKSEKLASLINNVIDKVDSSLSYKDFAMAVGKILKDEYGSHLYSSFVQELNKELKKENESIKLTSIMTSETKNSIREALTISIRNLIDDLVPRDIQNATTPQQMERRTSFIRDLVKTLNYFYKQNRVDWRFADSNLKFKMYSKD